MSFWKCISIAADRNRLGRLLRVRQRKAHNLGIEPLEVRAMLTSVSGDFNGDGIADLAIGIPTQTVKGVSNAGEVQILYGTPRASFVQSDGTVNAGLNGLTSKNSQMISEASLGITPQAGDGFGSALAIGDFNRDGIMDLAIGAPGRKVNGVASAGAVFIIFGSHSGLKTTGVQTWTEASLNRVAAGGDRFGSALATGDFNNDHTVDLAIGAPNKAVSGKANAGVVDIIYGASGGLASFGNQQWDQHQLSASTFGAGDLFGSALAVGDFNADGFRDLAVGAPGQSVGGNASAGAVNVLYGTRSGLNSVDNQFWTAAASSILGNSNAGAQFGFSLATGDFNDDSRSDLVIGAPGEDIDANSSQSIAAVSNAGAVHVLFGSTGRLTSTNNQLWNDNSNGIGDGAAQSGDRFGASLATGRFNSDQFSDLAIGIPNEVLDSGTVRVIYGSKTGLSATGTQRLFQDSSGVPEDAVSTTHFGADLTAGDFNDDHISDLYVSVPGNLGSDGVTGGLDVFAGGSTALSSGANNQVWLPDGVQVLVKSSGTGSTHPTDSSQVTVDYVGRLTDGKVFDSSASHGGPQTFSVSNVIQGFAKALQLMVTGDDWQVFIPSALAYGSTGPPPLVGPNQDLIFDLQLVSFS